MGASGVCATTAWTLPMKSPDVVIIETHNHLAADQPERCNMLGVLSREFFCLMIEGV
jgi:hypothetical protein